MVIEKRSEERFEGRISGLGGLTMGMWLVGLKVVWVVGLRGLDLGGGVVDRNGLGLPNLVLGGFGHIH
jgi:hypothetical protein